MYKPKCISMTTRKKNLQIEDANELKNYESAIQKTNSNRKIKIQDIPLNIKSLSPKQEELDKAIQNFDIIIAQGSGGTGKTFQTLVSALKLLREYPDKYKKLILIKSFQVIKEESIGFLKGDLFDKILPFMYSYTLNLDKIFGNKSVTQSLIEQDIIELYPIAYVRGVTFSDSIICVDETQNLSLHTFRTLASRIGKNSKLIFLGDSDQIDLKNKNESCLQKVCDLFKHTEFVNIVKFNGDNNIRNSLIPKILDILKDQE